MSSINPNNIDGTYPIAGQDNDSQGFRDNFTNIKNNLTFAKTEIEDLAGKVLLKSALSGTTLSNDMNNVQLINPQLLQVTHTTNDIGSTGISGAKTVDWEDGHFQYFETSGDVTLTLDGWPTSGFWTNLILEVTPGTAGDELVLPSEVTVGTGALTDYHSGNTTITFSTTDVKQYEFSTYDNGTTVAIRPLIQD